MKKKKKKAACIGIHRQTSQDADTLTALNAG
jgi:hypothetical protein